MLVEKKNPLSSLNNNLLREKNERNESRSFKERWLNSPSFNNKKK